MLTILHIYFTCTKTDNIGIETNKNLDYNSS